MSRRLGTQRLLFASSIQGSSGRSRPNAVLQIARFDSAKPPFNGEEGPYGHLHAAKVEVQPDCLAIYPELRTPARQGTRRCPPKSRLGVGALAALRGNHLPLSERGAARVHPVANASLPLPTPPEMKLYIFAPAACISLLLCCPPALAAATASPAASASAPAAQDPLLQARATAKTDKAALKAAKAKLKADKKANADKAVIDADEAQIDILSKRLRDANASVRIEMQRRSVPTGT
jgi:hypothetical protein